jgi:SatD family (SatD)
MNGKKNLILMADVVGSRKIDQRKLMNNFKEIVQHINENEKGNFLSPATITLGDEFQSVVRNLPAALSIIFKLEEAIIIKEMEFTLRYVLMEGKIETPINKNIAYGMLGPGLTTARECLDNLKDSKNRFYFKLIDVRRGNALNHAFLALQSLIDDWSMKKDYYIVAQFLLHKDYKQVAVELHKERSLMWKREKSLKLAEYYSIKEVIKFIGEDLYA